MHKDGQIQSNSWTCQFTVVYIDYQLYSDVSLKLLDHI